MTIDSFLTQLSEHCGVAADDLQVDITEDGEYLRVVITVPEEDSGIFIGYHGETLDSIQRLVRIIFQEEYPDHKIMVNLNNYREQREDRLCEITQSVADRVLETGESYTFNSYFPAHERYIIHSYLASDEKYDELESVSDGSGKNRKLTIQFKA